MGLPGGLGRGAGRVVAGAAAGLDDSRVEGSGLSHGEESRAFPGWTAQEIHRALNEPDLSDATLAALRRIGHTLGAAEGTGPDDDPFLRAAHGGQDGVGARNGVEQVFKARGMPVSATLPRRLAELGGVSTAALEWAALECGDEEDLLRLVSGRQ